MRIHCHSYQIFMIAIATLVERGLGFDADADTFVITLTGAH